MKREKVWVRKYNLNYMATFLWALVFGAQKFLKQPILSVLSRGILDQTGAWMNPEEKKDFDLRVSLLFLKNWQSFKKYIGVYHKLKNEFLKVAEKINLSNLNSFSSSRLSLLYQEFEKINTEFMIVGQWSAFEMIEQIPDIVKEKLEKEKIPPEEINKILSIILTPFNATKAFEEEEEVLRLAYKVKNGTISKEKLSQEISQLVKKYGWMPSITMDNESWDAKFFRGQIDKLEKSGDLVKSMKNFERMEEERKGKQKDFKNLLLRYPKFKDLFRIANWLIYLKDERDETRRLAYNLSRPLFYEIAKRAKIDISQLLAQTPPEILAFLKSGILLPPEEIEGRKRSFVIFLKNKKFVIYSGKKADEYSRKYLEKEETVEAKEISGTIASPGKVQGVIKIVMDKNDLGKIERGDVMVAVTTHPDYLPAMKLSKAIVTDEGGLTCHAAIVARELKIPCIVGTKIATKVLCDGDLVEVDATKGVVKKIHPVK